MKMFLERTGQDCLPTKFNDYVGVLKRSDVVTAEETSNKNNLINFANTIVK